MMSPNGATKRTVPNPLRIAFCRVSARTKPLAFCQLFSTKSTHSHHPAAIDVGSGKSAHYEWTEGQDSAAEQAALSLFNTVLGADACSCNHVSYAYGSCSLDISVCFMFNSTADLVAKKPSFKAWCTDTNHSRAGHVTQYVDPQDAAAAAGEDLLAKFPDEPTLCNASATSFRALFNGAAPQ
jgi:hypothetical protein